MGLKQIDRLVYEKNLRGLNLTDNQLQELSEDIIQLQDLKYIILNNNEIKILPYNLGKIPELQQI